MAAMTEEDAFLAGIAANPLDDLRRLVYADWLDERGRAEQAEYLRLVAALAATGDAIDVTHPHAVRLLALADGIDHAWRTATGGRFDLWFDGYDPAHKIRFIKLLRELRGYGLAEAKTYSESLPRCFCGGVTMEEATGVANWFAHARPPYRVVPSKTNPMENGPRRKVVLLWDAGWFPDEQAHLDPEAAFVHLRRLLLRAPELAALADTLPEEVEADTNQFTVSLTDWFPFDEVTRRVESLAVRLLENGVALDGEHADPPFPGIIHVCPQ